MSIANTIEHLDISQLKSQRPRTRLLGTRKLELFDHQPAVAHLETGDFPLADPWTAFTRDQIRARALRGEFRGRDFTEFGIGDGRNVRQAGPGLRHVEGVDVEEWRLYAAAVNLTTGPDAHQRTSLNLYRGDAVDFIQEYVKSSGRTIEGNAVACLPQSPVDDDHTQNLGEEHTSIADYYTVTGATAPFQERWNDVGLTLNAAVLANAREVADKDLRLLVVLSDRIPDSARHELIAETGWQTVRETRTEEPVQQDSDTSIGWARGIDFDKKRFWEKDTHGIYQPISAAEAERRRLVSEVNGTGREGLNVFHHLYVVELKPSERKSF